MKYAEEIKLFNVYYNYDKSMSYEATTDNFEKWLEEHNKDRVKENGEEDSDFSENWEEDADDFEVEEIGLALYDDKIKSFKIYTDDTDEDKVLVGDDVETALEILENNGYIVEVEYEND